MNTILKRNLQLNKSVFCAFSMAKNAPKSPDRTVWQDVKCQPQSILFLEVLMR